MEFFFFVVVEEEVVGSTMVDTQRMDKHQLHLRNFFKNMRLLPNTLCLVLRIRMVWQNEEIEPY